MELTDEMKSKMSFAEIDKTYIPKQEKLPVVAYQIVKNLIGFVVGQHKEIKRLDTKVRMLEKKVREGTAALTSE